MKYMGKLDEIKSYIVKCPTLRLLFCLLGANNNFGRFIIDHLFLNKNYEIHLFLYNMAFI